MFYESLVETRQKIVKQVLQEIKENIAARKLY